MSECLIEDMWNQVRRFYTNLRRRDNQPQVVAKRSEARRIIIAKPRKRQTKSRFAPNKAVGYDTGYRMKRKTSVTTEVQ